MASPQFDDPNAREADDDEEVDPSYDVDDPDSFEDREEDEY
jgi:hypothetical protein